MPADHSFAEYKRPFDRSLCDLTPPPVDFVSGNWWVARDDLLLGGSKSRYLRAIVQAVADQPDEQEIVYAGPAQGGMALCLAVMYGARATLCYGERKVLTPRQQETLLYGAAHVYSPYPRVRPAMVKKLAREYAQQNDALCIRWSLSYPEVVDAIGEVAATVEREYGHFDEVWVAGGGGTIARGLRAGFPESTQVVTVPIGRVMRQREVPGVVVLPMPNYAMDKPVKLRPPFPHDMYYDGKAWEVAWIDRPEILAYDDQNAKRKLFWNVIGPTINDPQRPAWEAHMRMRGIALKSCP